MACKEESHIADLPDEALPRHVPEPTGQRLIRGTQGWGLTFWMAALHESLQVGEAVFTGHAACTVCAAVASPDSVVMPCAMHADGTWAQAPVPRATTTVSISRAAGRMVDSKLGNHRPASGLAGQCCCMLQLAKWHKVYVVGTHLIEVLLPV